MNTPRRRRVGGVASTARSLGSYESPEQRSRFAVPALRSRERRSACSCRCTITRLTPRSARSPRCASRRLRFVETDRRSIGGRSGIDRNAPACAAVGVHGSKARVAGEDGKGNVRPFLEGLVAHRAEPRSPCGSDLARNASPWARVRRRTARTSMSRARRTGRPPCGLKDLVPRIDGRRRRFNDLVAAFADQLACEVRGRPSFVLVGRAREGDELLDPIDAAHCPRRDTTQGCSSPAPSRPRAAR